MKSAIFKSTLTAALLMLALPLLSYAANPPQSVDDIVKILGNILLQLSRIFWVVTVIMVLYAAYLFVFGTSADNVEKAKKQILYASIAIAVALISTVLPTLVQNILLGS